jgi:hypothetical protein
LLRKDIHRLFDDGLLTVDPSSLKISVSASLEEFKEYSQQLAEPLTEKRSADPNEGGARSSVRSRSSGAVLREQSALEGAR